LAYHSKDVGLGSSLEAEVTLFCDAELRHKLSKLQDELRFVLITSKAQILSIEQAPSEVISTGMSNLVVTVIRSEHDKCERCWHRSADVDSDPKFPRICQRCVDNLSLKGENRVYA